MSRSRSEGNWPQVGGTPGCSRLEGSLSESWALWVHLSHVSRPSHCRSHATKILISCSWIIIQGERDSYICTSVWEVLGKDPNRLDPETRLLMQVEYLGKGTREHRRGSKEISPDVRRVSDRNKRDMGVGGGEPSVSRELPSTVAGELREGTEQCGWDINSTLVCCPLRPVVPDTDWSRLGHMSISWVQWGSMLWMEAPSTSWRGKKCPTPKRRIVNYSYQYKCRRDYGHHYNYKRYSLPNFNSITGL